eukprot:12202009-Alexandrium_andersonii.AAC.1
MGATPAAAKTSPPRAARPARGEVATRCCPQPATGCATGAHPRMCRGNASEGEGSCGGGAI